MVRNFWIYFIGAGLLACSSVTTINYKSQEVKVENLNSKHSSIDSIISPYRNELNKEMNQVLAKANIDFLVSRPCGSMNNWFSDALLNSQIESKKFDAPAMCLFNTGGIRSSINKGDVTLGDMYKVMPFDNTIVYVKMPISSISFIENYLGISGGEPISGAVLKNGKLIFNESLNSSSYFWVITSDYLFNGGDKMTFFNQNLSSEITDILVRNVLIEEVKKQKVLLQDTLTRMSF
jgi:2',3'-cyclic-nucleotide 2'-phosphodiesterase (5'-nucleotidase family)